MKTYIFRKKKTLKQTMASWEKKTSPVLRFEGFEKRKMPVVIVKFYLNHMDKMETII